MPKVSDLIEHINNQYPVLDLTTNIVKGVYFLDTQDAVSEVPVNIQSPNAIAMIAGKPMVYSESDGSSFDSIDSWKEIATYPTDYDELVGVDLIDPESNLLDRYEVILYDSIESKFKKANLDSVFGGLAAFIANTYTGSITIVNPDSGIFGDLDGDGTVGVNDLLALLSVYNTDSGVDWIDSDIVFTHDNGSISVNYNIQSYSAGDELYVDSLVSLVIQSGTYEVSVNENVGFDNYGDIDSVNSISIYDPVSDVAELPSLNDALPLIEVYSGYNNLGLSAGIYFLSNDPAAAGSLSNMTFGISVRFFGDQSDGYSQVGDEIILPLYSQYSFTGNGSVVPSMGAPSEISGDSSLVKTQWDLLRQNYNIDEIRLNPYIVFDTPNPGNDAEAGIYQVSFMPAGFGIKVKAPEL